MILVFIQDMDVKRQLAPSARITHIYTDNVKFEAKMKWGFYYSDRFAYSTLEKVLIEAEKSAAITHNHTEGIKGAQAVAAAIFLVRNGQSKCAIKEYLHTTFNYDLSFTIEEIRPHTYFDETCQVSVPQAIIAFLDSTDYEDAVRKAISLGADAATQACIAGGIAQAFYKNIPDYIIQKTRQNLPREFSDILDEFNAKYYLNL